MNSKVKAKMTLDEREQISELVKLPRATISIVALKSCTGTLAKSETRTYCGLGSQFRYGKPVLAPLIPLARSLLWQTASGLDGFYPGVLRGREQVWSTGLW
jgi:hypothetical protein